MKRFILIAAALVAAASSAKADETSESILRHIAETFASYGNYEVRFTVSAQGMGNMSGNYFVSGDRYRIKLQKQEQFSDGTNRYEIYAADKEVVIDAADTGSHNILNPANGAPITVPSQDMVLGLYYITKSRPAPKAKGWYSTARRRRLSPTTKAVPTCTPR